MKRSKFFLYFIAILVFGFTSVIYTSCRKDKCAGVTCSGNGTCSGGACTCYAGWTGANCDAVAQTVLQYVNNTYTPVYMTVGGSAYTIQPGASISFSGYAFDYISGTAYTSGYTTGGSPLGTTINWDLSQDQFPQSGTYTINLNVSSSYFFLRIQNNSTYSIGTMEVNYNLPTQTLEYVSLQPGYIYNIGYYSASYNPSPLHLVSTNGLWAWDNNCPLPGGANQSYTFVAN